MSYQAPPRAQQLNLLDFFILPHLGHSLPLTADTLVVAGASVGMKAFKVHKRRQYPPARLTQSNELTCACLDTFEPCMIKVWVARISAVVEPIAATSTATELAGFLDDTALGTLFAAYAGYACRRGCFCRHAGFQITQNISIHAGNVGSQMR